MDRAVLEQEAKKLFGGATIDIQPYQDGLRMAWDVTIIPYIDKEVRFIRVSTTEGMPMVNAYLKKMQQNLLKMNHNGVFGINPVAEKIDAKAVEEEIEKRLPKNKETFACLECNKTYKFEGRLVNHRKTHKKTPQSIVSAVNEAGIYNAK